MFSAQTNPVEIKDTDDAVEVEGMGMWKEEHAFNELFIMVDPSQDFYRANGEKESIN